MTKNRMTATQQVKRPIRPGEFPALMQKWAEYVDMLENELYSSTTVLSRAMEGQLALDGEFSSQLPVGLDKLYVSPQLKDLIDALERLERDDAEKITKPVDATKKFYQAASKHVTGADRRAYTAKVLEISTGTLQKLLETGEALILREMNR